MVAIAIFVISILGSMIAFYNVKNFNVNIILGKFFRDLSRYKSRKRLFSRSSTSLMNIVLGSDKDILLTEIPIESEEFTLNIQQLSEMNGKTDEIPIYISILNNIYDVSQSRSMYGPGKAYHGFVAKDATYCYATANSDIDCDKQGNIDNLTEEQLFEANKWIEFYHNHDKYQYIGKLVLDPVDKFVENAILLNER